MASSIRLPSSLLIDITNKAAAQVFLRMGKNDRGSRPRVLKYVMGAGNAFQDPSVPFKATFYIAAVR
jgi:hypothetical protein